MRDHGGNLDWAMQHWGGAPEDWIDLSTGINRVAYPVPKLPASAWTGLPTRSEIAALSMAARQAYGATGTVLPVAGAQAAIQMVPRLCAPGLARVLTPTYNEHAAALRSGGWTVEEVADPEALAGADLAVVVNPNNPDGRRTGADDLVSLLPRVGRLIVDESFADPDPAQTLCPQTHWPGLLVLRSFGKFYGLAGLRLGFVIGGEADIATLAEMAGPWPVSGAAIRIGSAALRDRPWAEATTARLRADAARLDGMAARPGWTCVGGTELFRLYETPDAKAAQDRLAETRIWSRRFPYSARWLRLGLPGNEAEWARLEAGLA